MYHKLNSLFNTEVSEDYDEEMEEEYPDAGEIIDDDEDEEYKVCWYLFDICWADQY